MICNLKGDVIMKRLISVGEFFELQKSDKKLVVLDCRFDLMNKTYGIDSYKEGHIKDAYLINIEKDLTDPVGQHGGRHPFNPVKQPRFLQCLCFRWWPNCLQGQWWPDRN